MKELGIGREGPLERMDRGKPVTRAPHYCPNLPAEMNHPMKNPDFSQQGLVANPG